MSSKMEDSSSSKQGTPSSSTNMPSPSASPPIKRRKVGSGASSVKGCTILLTGLAKSGKSTISDELTQMLKRTGVPVKQLDGKKMRAGLCKELDLANAVDRSCFVHLTSEAAKLFTEEGYISIISIVAPLAQDREKARLSHLESNLPFLEVFVDRPREECERLTGLLRNALSIGAPIDANYESPTNPDIHLKPSGRSTASMCNEIVDTLVANNIIPQPHIPLMLPPLSPIPPSPSPSSNDGAFSTAEENDDTDHDEGGNVTNALFKLPRKGSDLLAIFTHVKAEMISRGFTGSDEQVDKDPLFLDIMGEWKEHYDTHSEEERFFPVHIPQPTRKKTTPTTTPKKATTKTPPKNKQDFIPLYWNGITLRFGKMSSATSGPSNYKCGQCWKNATGCTLHSTTKMAHFAIVRDANETTTQYYVVLIQTTNIKMEWSHANLPRIGRKNSVTLLLKYLKSRPNSNFIEIYAKSMLMSSPERKPIMHTLKLSTGLICLFRNMERIHNNNALILPHEMLQNRIDMRSANLAVLETTLSFNGITFAVGDDVEVPPTKSPLAATYCWKLPRVYMGTQTDKKINVGLRYAMRGTDDHSATHEQRGEIFTSGTLYQTPLSNEQIAIGESIPVSTPQDKWTPQQQALHKLVEDDCRRKEALGITALIIAEMKGLSGNGIQIIRDNKKYENLDTVEVGDIVYLQNVLKFMSGHTVTITVVPSNEMKFTDAFFQ